MKKNEAVLKKRQALYLQIPRSPKIIKGSLVELRRVCGKANCRCGNGEKHRSLYLSQSYRGRTRMTYIPRKYEKEITECVQRHKELVRIADKISELNIKIIRERGKI